MTEPPPDERLRPALEALARRDRDIARAYAACGLPARRRHEADFAGLLRIVVAQQVSAHAARAILGRLDAACRPLAPAAFLALGDDDLRAVGLSRQKMRYGRLIAEAAAEGRLDFGRLAAADDAAAMAELQAIKGIGRWTAEIFLLFALERPDVFPAQDLALQVAGQRLKGLAARPGARELRALAEAWRPARSAAARFLWHVYRHPGAPTGGGDAG